MDKHNFIQERITSLPRITPNEMRPINKLIHQAMLSITLAQRLINTDVSLKQEFNISDSAWHAISEIRVSTLSEFCGEIERLQAPHNTSEQIA
ncbi:MAG: hypothetical protein AAFR67_15100, partial [Chloroflexota bacterium]